MDEVSVPISTDQKEVTTPIDAPSPYSTPKSLWLIFLVVELMVMLLLLAAGHLLPGLLLYAGNLGCIFVVPDEWLGIEKRCQCQNEHVHF